MTIRVVWGTGTGPTEMAAYDAALADANVHNYNLVAVSSVIPADVDVEAVGTAPGLGPAGNRLTVVEAHASGAGPCQLSAGLGWAESGGGPGLFYEDAGESDAADVEKRVRAGLDAGKELRDWAFERDRLQSVTIDVDSGEYGAAVVLAAYGESTPIVGE
ncbi:pyruvoyl-dependent arginine decarboxylase [Halobacterium zhouii]|uniref:pyruvoyl-dependent arginine decarboxylase n=1 Tax=Halobacterium zhouii TaxID=2902624 RepID=UPI001E4D0608|nr:pyruvoyl-dependent arginine decarboxylase [Halobacterium zhouii]